MCCEVKGSSDVSTTMSIFISLPNFKPLCVLLAFLNAGVRQKKFFSQDAFNTHGFVCVSTFISGYLPVKSWFPFWGIDVEGVEDLWQFLQVYLTSNEGIYVDKSNKYLLL